MILQYDANDLITESGDVFELPEQENEDCRTSANTG